MRHLLQNDILGKAMSEYLKTARAFTKLLKRHLKDRLVSVVLYGSVASGQETSESDVDLLLVIREMNEGHYRRRLLLDPIFEEWDRAQKDPKPFISTILKTPEEAQKLSAIYFDMVDRSQILVDRDNFFRNILKNVETRLIRLGAKRRRLGKIEYWDLKPDYKPGEIFEI
ncbi:MAG: nucleotidyltransferase domain-containing protein [Deltaproteobacteria bacterium]|nr:nucleotidyltransferase domain-containing protein [Deltaproteobacteria bacterium]